MTKKQKTHEEKVQELEKAYQPLKLSTIQKELNELEREETYVVDGLTNEVIKYNPIFDQNKINEIIIELQEKLNYIKKNNINFLKNDHELFNYVYFLIVKKFTHFKNEIKDDLESQIAQMNALVRLGYFELIMSEVFDPKQVTRVTDKVLQLAEYGDRVKSLENKAKQKSEQVLNKAKAIQKSKKVTKKK